MTGRRRIGDRIPGRIARVKRIRTVERDGRPFVVYELTNSLHRPGLPGGGAAR
jgi:hypothetical protein